MRCLKPPPVPGILWLAIILFAGWLTFEATQIAYSQGYVRGEIQTEAATQAEWRSRKEVQIEATADLMQARNPKLYRAKAVHYSRLIYEECEKQGVGHLQLVAQMSVESGLNEYATGAAGEIGLMQILPWWLDKAEELGLNPVTEQELYDPANNIKWGVAILARCLRNTNGNLHKALCFYNAGPKWQNGIKYADKVLRLRSQLEEQTAQMQAS
jgi:soluble lytic murein transglycosylase-like protein